MKGQTPSCSVPHSDLLRGTRFPVSQRHPEDTGGMIRSAPVEGLHTHTLYEDVFFYAYAYYSRHQTPNIQVL